MNHLQAKDLFELQTELIDMKVDMVVGKTIDRVIEQISGLKYQIHTEIHGLRDEMNQRFSSLDNRVVAVETKLGMVNDKQDKISTAVIQYAFKAGWAAMGLCATYLFYLFCTFHK